MLKLVHTSTKEIQNDYKYLKKKNSQKKTIAKNLDGDISNVHSKLYPDMTLTSQTIKSILLISIHFFEPKYKQALL